jgi:hypothetical protein
VSEWSSRLRLELSSLAPDYSTAFGHAMYKSGGGTVLFASVDGGARHGSFADESYAAILADHAWHARLDKPHAQRYALPEERRATACELDSCNSSDALLMNFFCFPGFSSQPCVVELLGHDPAALPEFGVPGRVPLLDGDTDATEIDMRIGGVIVESKLTEADFTSRAPTVLKRYRDFESVFDPSALPTTAGRIDGYQLIRNVLCAAEHGYTFVLLCDARRPDLIRSWWQVVRAVRDVSVRARCRLVLWQELAAEASPELRAFLGAKYGFPESPHVSR